MQVKLGYLATRQLAALPHDTQQRIVDKLKYFASQANPFVYAKRVQGKHIYRFRVGDYRALFEVKGNVILILLIERRDKAYD